MQTQQRLLGVLAHIEAHLDEPLELERLCRVARWSKYHFHRQWRRVLGLPVAELVRRLRLKRAAFQLAYRPDRPVVEVALGAGYASHEAFSRAFKRCFGSSPSGFRHSPDWAPWLEHYRPVLNLRRQAMQLPDLSRVDVVEVDATPIAVMDHLGPVESLGRTLGRFIEWRRANGLAPGRSRTFNLLYEDPVLTPAAEYRFGLACSVRAPVDEENGEVINRVIPAGYCARLRHQGSDDGLGAVVESLFYQWLPDSGYALGDFPVYVERLRFFPDVAEHEALADVYLPLSDARGSG